MNDSSRRVIVGGAVVAAVALAMGWLALRGGEDALAPAEDPAATSAAASASDLPASVPAPPPLVETGLDAPTPIEVAAESLPRWVPTGRVTGRFVTARGEPVRGAAVELFESPQSAALAKLFEPFAREVSDARGRFEFARVPSGFAFDLLGTLPDKRDVGPIAAAVPTGQTLDLGDILVTDAARLQGLVTDARGEFIAGATVAAAHDIAGFGLGFGYAGCNDAGEPPGWQARTGADGEFTLDGLPPRLLTVLAMAPGHGRSVKQVTVLVGKPNIVEFALPDELVIAGRVVDARGEPVADARVQAVPDERAEMRCTRTNARGEYLLDELVGGSYQLEASAGLRRQVEPGVQAGRRDVLLQLREGNRLETRIEVLDGSGHLAAGARLLCTWPGFGPSRTNVLNAGNGSDVLDLKAWASEPAGTFVVRGLELENVSFWAQTATSSSPPRALARDSHSLTLRLQPAAPVHGTVLDAQTGAPLAGAQVSIRLASPAVTLPDGMFWSDEQGRFSLASPPVGPLRVWAHAADHFPTEISVAPEQRGEVVLRLAPSGSVLLRLDEALVGRPIQSRSLRFRRAGNAWDTDTKFDGRPRLVTGLKAGPLEVEVLAEDGDDTALPSGQRLRIVEVRAGEVIELRIPLPLAVPASASR